MKKFLPNLLKYFSYLSFFAYFAVFVFFICYLLSKTNNLFSVEAVFSDTAPLKALLLKEPVFDGLFPAIFGTIMIVVLSVAISVPAGVGTGIWLSEYGKGKKYFFISILIDILSGLPSIVIGLFGFSFILIFHKLFPGKSPGFSMAVASFALAVLVLPYIAKSTENAIKAMDKSLKLAALSLGAGKTENIKLVILPNAFSSILSGILLAIARCAEDTAVIMLTGAVANAGIPGSIFERFEALSFFIYYTSSEYTSSQELSMAFNAAVMLIFICSALFAMSFIIKKFTLRKN